MRKKLIGIIMTICLFTLAVFPVMADEVDPAVQRSYSAYVAIQEAMMTPSPDVVDELEYLIEEFTNANEELSDEQIEELVALAGAEDIWEIIGNTMMASYVVYAANAFDAYVADANVTTAMELVDAYEMIIEIEIDIEAFVPGIEAAYEAAKIDAPSEDVLAVFAAWSNLAFELSMVVEEFLAEAIEAWNAVADIFEAFGEEDLQDLAALMDEPDAEAAKNAVFSTVVDANVLYMVAQAYNDFGENWDVESAKALIEVYDGIFNNPDFEDETLEELIYENFLDIDDLYAEAKLLVGSTSPKTGDNSIAWSWMFLIVTGAAFGMIMLKKYSYKNL